MELFTQATDINLIGIEVETFPLGISKAFDSLANTFGLDRAYYGISWCENDGKIKYYAMTTESNAVELQGNNYEKLIIPKGEYRSITVFDWMAKTDRIKDFFQELIGEGSPDKNNPCVELYKSDAEMVCMVRN